MAGSRPDAIVTDLDGTLLKNRTEMGREDAAAILRLKEMGVPVVVCTGRHLIGTRPLMAELGLEFAICSNGSHCRDFLTGEDLFLTLMDRDAAGRLTRWLAEEKVEFLLHARRRIYYTSGTKPPAHYHLLEGEDGGVITPETSLENEEVLKILAVRCDEKAVLKKAREMFREEMTICSSEAFFVDFNAAGVTKGNGLRRLAEQKGWRMKNILALGDNSNDLPMLEAVGMSAVPGDGLPQVKAAAGFVTAPCGENPLTAAVRHFWPTLLEGI